MRACVHFLGDSESIVTMPHALSMPAPGFQAVILCGPGVSFDTFTSKPEESPKALIPIANRPMVWYPLEFCYRMGITSTLDGISLRLFYRVLLFEYLSKLFRYRACDLCMILRESMSIQRCHRSFESRNGQVLSGRLKYT